jgi:hypothetical protein
MFLKPSDKAEIFRESIYVNRVEDIELICMVMPRIYGYMMTNYSEESCALAMLEESLWVPKTRFDKDYMESILDKDFFEFGRSGRIYTRAECINTIPQEINAKLPLENFNVQIVDKNVRLVTYISEIADTDIKRANRSSLWIRRDGHWYLCFHQGTPI